VQNRPDTWLPTLDGWRAIAILLVLWHHATMSLYTAESDYWGSSVSRYGAFGVDVFFAISGLLITTLLLRQGVQLRPFYIRRAFRILPPLFVFLAVAVVLGRMQPGPELWSSLFLFRNYLPNGLGGHTSGHLWSLSIEEHFYLLWPATLAYFAQRRSAHPVAYLAIAAGMWRLVDAQYALTSGIFNDLPEHFRTDLRLDSLLWGCFAAFLLKNAKVCVQARGPQVQPWFWVALDSVLLGVVLYSYLTGLWIAMLLPMLLLLTLLNPEWSVSRVLDSAPLRAIGRISYSLYLWQQLFLVPGWITPPTSLVGNLAATFVAAIASYFLIERPAIALGRRLARSYGMASRRSNTSDAVAVRISAY
jgi:peptidoglycan/LPS O-acetylase OafA/YrhL